MWGPSAFIIWIPPPCSHKCIHCNTVNPTTVITTTWMIRQFIFGPAKTPIYSMYFITVNLTFLPRLIRQHGWSDIFWQSQTHFYHGYSDIWCFNKIISSKSKTRIIMQFINHFLLLSFCNYLTLYVLGNTLCVIFIVYLPFLASVYKISDQPCKISEKYEKCRINRGIFIRQHGWSDIFWLVPWDVGLTVFHCS